MIGLGSTIMTCRHALLLTGVGLPRRAEPASDLPERLGSVPFPAFAFHPAPLVWARRTGAGMLRVQRGDGAVRLLGAQHPAQTRLTVTTPSLAPA
jgi:hypothetical protein